MKLHFFLLSMITVLTVSTGLHAFDIVGSAVEGAGDIVSDVGRGVSNVGGAIADRPYYYGYYDNHYYGRPVGYDRIYEVRPDRYVEPVSVEEMVY